MRTLVGGKMPADMIGIGSLAMALRKMGRSDASRVVTSPRLGAGIAGKGPSGWEAPSASACAAVRNLPARPAICLSSFGAMISLTAPLNFCTDSKMIRLIALGTRQPTLFYSSRRGTHRFSPMPMASLATRKS